MQVRQRINIKKNLCKQCKKEPLHSLYFCKGCLEKHNRYTKATKDKYKAQGKCVNCGTKSTTHKCVVCMRKSAEGQKVSLFQKSKQAKSGKYNKLKEIIEVI